MRISEHYFYKEIVYFSIMEEVKQKSSHWDNYCTMNSSIDGFPFNEGFPTGGPFGNVDKVYELILRTGEKIDARVDYSTQYRSEGLRWQTFGRGSLERAVVAAWQEK